LSTAISYRSARIAGWFPRYACLHGTMGLMVGAVGKESPDVPIDEATALRIAQEAVDRSGGNPRHPFSLSSTREYEIEGYTILICFSEVTSPAVVEVADYVFEILPEGLVKLFCP
jgi:hypothetical protein